MSEPVALRYDFDGNGYLYMDAGSGSDWASRVKDCEFLYTHPMRDLTDKEIYDLSQLHLVAKIGSCGEATGDIDGEIDFARAIIKASRSEK